MMSKSRWGLNWKLFSPKAKEKKKNFTKVDNFFKPWVPLSPLLEKFFNTTFCLLTYAVRILAQAMNYLLNVPLSKPP